MTGARPRMPSVVRLLAAQIGYQARLLSSGRAVVIGVGLPVILLIASHAQRSNTTSAAGIAGYAAFGLTLTAWNTYGVRLVAAREAGVLKRWRATPLPRWCYFLSRILATVVVSVLAGAATVAVGVLLYGMHLTVSGGLAALVAFTIGAFAWAATATALTAAIPTVEAAAPTMMLTYFPVIIISGILFVIEFFVDKIPWLDSLWDAIHTVIRPIGGGLLAIQALGHPSPVFNVIIGLIAGAVTFTSHSVKTGTRLMVNQSPEPFSNVAVSLGENLLVGAMFALLWSHPLVALAILLVFFSIAFYFLPRIWRTIRMRIFFIRQKMKQPARRTAVELLASLPHAYERWFHKLVQPQQTVRWAVPCITGKGRLIPRDQFGYLTATEQQLSMVFFVVKGWFASAKLFEIDDFEPTLRQRFLYDEIILSTPGKNDRYSFRFDRSQAGLAPLVLEDLKRRMDTSRQVLLMPPSEPITEQAKPAHAILRNEGTTFAPSGPDGNSPSQSGA